MKNAINRSSARPRPASSRCPLSAPCGLRWLKWSGLLEDNPFCRTRSFSSRAASSRRRGISGRAEPRGPTCSRRPGLRAVLPQPQNSIGYENRMADVWGAQWNKAAAGLLREGRNAPLLTRLYTTKRWAWPRTRAVRPFRNSARGHLLSCIWMDSLHTKTEWGEAE